MSLTARITEDIVPGTVLAPGIWWNKHSANGYNANGHNANGYAIESRNINQVTPQDEADMGAGALFYDVRVWIEPAKPVSTHDAAKIEGEAIPAL